MSGDYASLLRRRALAMLDLSRRLLAEGLYDLAVFNAEYAAQLYLKSLLYRLAGEEYRGHSIRALMGALSMMLRDKGLKELAEEVEGFVRENRRLLAELEEAHTRAVYGVFEYPRSQAEALVEAANKVVKLLMGVESRVFPG